MGNQMKSSAIWNKKAQVNFSKTTKKQKKTSFAFDQVKKICAVFKFITAEKLFNEHKLL